MKSSVTETCRGAAGLSMVISALLVSIFSFCYCTAEVGRLVGKVKYCLKPRFFKMSITIETDLG